MKKFILLIVTGFLFFLNAPTIFGDNLSIDKIQALKEDNSKNDKLQQEQLKLDDKVANTEYDCLMAFGNEKFCSCLSVKLPKSIDFKDYISFITDNKHKLLSETQNKDVISMINGIFDTRYFCVNSLQEEKDQVSTNSNALD